MSNSIRPPTTSPWGAVEMATHRGSGIWFVSTSSHGGFYVPPEMLGKMPQRYVERSFRDLGRLGWFEEDQDAVKVVASFPHLFSRAEVEQALRWID